MTNNPAPRFHHAGKSTQDLLDAQRVLKVIGLKKGDTFLDAGSGSGYLSVAASEIVGSEGRVYAVDVDKPSIDALKREIDERGIQNLTAIVTDITAKTPLASESIDICLMANALHGFVENNEVEGVLKEISRVLKPGATLAVVEFKKLENIPGPPFPVKLSPEQVTAIIAPYRYRQKEVTEVGAYHYAVTFVKE
ncbi:MAG: class I SAM-dependent methyltransferase [Chloroflexi bacterium]|nr:class I SAM-dependent methyltransferase [Chloroflexota bacterium]